ncbi:MAG: hypothetical protein HY299_15785 [Verrucomicrobia bacterium]|nr:hypothetical protein [Verrucomicrobiota bacterium]
MEFNTFTVRLGQIVITPNALESVHSTDIEQAILNHSRGNWGDVSPEDAAENNRSLTEGYRILSAYSDRHGRKFWIITEADRSVTTILLPEDY